MPDPLLPPSPPGRRFVGQRKVRLGDVDRTGRLRLDALTRYTQDVSDDDTTDAGLAPNPGWVVRSTVVDELEPARLAETITCETFCSALGKRWAERRLSITGDGGARYEVATLWVCVDVDAGRPTPLTDQFLALYGDAAAGRSVSARLQNPKPVDVSGPREPVQWQLRVADYDIYDHVNNAAYWAVVEQVMVEPLGAAPAANPWPRRMRLEYGQGVGVAEAVPIVVHQSPNHHTMIWWLDGQGGTGGEGDIAAPTLASASILPLPTGLYE